MTYFSASLDTILLRYFLMMAIIIGSFSLGYPILALLSLPVFISAIAAISFTGKSKKSNQLSVKKGTEKASFMNSAA